jgi:hypothetical protein
MAATRTPGITLGADGRYFIDKRYRGVRIGMRVGTMSQELAEQRLQAEMQQVDVELARRARARPLFRDCAARYLVQCRDKRSLQAIQIHVRALLPHIGHLEPHQVHDATLASFVSQRIAAGVSATTINRSLEVVRTILHRAARSYRDDDGRPWLEAIPPLITMLPESRRPAYPITWEEQDRLFPKLPAHLQAHGAVRREHGIARQQRVRPRVDMGGGRPGDRPQRLRRTRGSVQEQPRPRGDPQRRGVVDRAGAARAGPDLGVPVPRPPHRDDEQQRLAEGAP